MLYEYINRQAEAAHGIVYKNILLYISWVLEKVQPMRYLCDNQGSTAKNAVDPVHKKGTIC